MRWCFTWNGFSRGKAIRSLATPSLGNWFQTLIPIKWMSFRVRPHGETSEVCHVASIHRYFETHRVYMQYIYIIYIYISDVDISQYWKGKASIQTWTKHAQYMFQPTIEPQICPKVYVCLSSSFVSWSSPASNISKHPWHHSKSYIRTESSYHPIRTV